MDYEYFQLYMLGFVSDVIQKLNVDVGQTRVAVVSFSESAQVRQNPDSHYGISTVGSCTRQICAMH